MRVSEKGLGDLRRHFILAYQVIQAKIIQEYISSFYWS